MSEIHLTLSHEQLNVIVGALGEQPYKVVAGVVSAIQQQLKAQLANAEGDTSQP